jgi:hypothetical protein
MDGKVFLEFGIIQIDGRARLMDNWLAEYVEPASWHILIVEKRMCGIVFTNSEDATAFKIRFGL